MPPTTLHATPRRRERVSPCVSGLTESMPSFTTLLDAARIESLLLSHAEARAALEAELANLESGAGPQSLLGEVWLALNPYSSTSETRRNLNRDQTRPDDSTIKQEGDVANHRTDLPSSPSPFHRAAAIKTERHDDTRAYLTEPGSIDHMPIVKYVSKTTHLRVGPVLWHPRNIGIPRQSTYRSEASMRPAVSLVERRTLKRALSVDEDIETLSPSTSSSMTKTHSTDDASRPAKIPKLSFAAPSAPSQVPVNSPSRRIRTAKSVIPPGAPRRSARLSGALPSPASRLSTLCGQTDFARTRARADNVVRNLPM